MTQDPLPMAASRQAAGYHAGLPGALAFSLGAHPAVSASCRHWVWNRPHAASGSLVSSQYT